MAVRFVLGNPYYNAGKNISETDFEAEISEYLKDYKDEKLDFAVKQTNHGVGYDAITATVAVTGFLLFGIPAAHKKIRESLAEWKLIYNNVQKVLGYVKHKQPIQAYSIEVAFLEALIYLEDQTNVEDLEVIEVIQLAGVKDKNVENDFEGALIMYYVFMFKQAEERIIILTYDSKLRRIDQHALPLDPRFLLTE